MSDIPIKVVSNEEAEKAQFVICMRANFPLQYPFPDNEKGVCGLCNAEIVFRPYAPKKPMKICMECAVEKLQAEEQ